ncbi:hypothetical protein CRENBAI_003423 [Crenichthys baileyi]|uniref:Uncharacterized protein n=1 Tax=Crenichthys baileyi TaxID=28760 RepID=A0AAV9SM73_9TELE
MLVSYSSSSAYPGPGRGAADSAETPRRPSPQTPPPAPPGGAQGVPRPVERHSPFSVSWAVPWVSSRNPSSLLNNGESSLQTDPDLRGLGDEGEAGDRRLCPCLPLPAMRNK